MHFSWPLIFSIALSSSLTSPQDVKMPVTVKPTSRKPYEVRSYKAETVEALLEHSCSKEYQSCKEVLQSSIDLKSSNPLYAVRNGFVGAAVAAYSSHHHLIIRPEDIWIAILTQFSIYVNAHAEELRNKFVSFEGKKELEIKADGNRWSVDFGELAHRMSYMLEENVVDEELREWIVPDFSTTTSNDEMVAAVIMMSTLQKYFDYKFTLTCGIPSVTLLGESQDWVKLLEKIEKLKTFGEEPSMWYQLLKPVLTGFIMTFNKPDSKDTTTFWNRIAHYESMGSGPTYYSGWITAFCFWDEGGKMLYNPPVNQPKQEDRAAEPSTVEKEKRNPIMSISGATTSILNTFKKFKPEIAATVPDYPTSPGDIIYHRVNTNDVPVGYSSVPVKIDDNGDIFMSTMIAGSVGMRGSSSGEAVAYRSLGYGRQTEKQRKREERGKKGIDTLQPEVGWFVFERKPTDKAEKSFPFSRR